MRFGARALLVLALAACGKERIAQQTDIVPVTVDAPAPAVAAAQTGPCSTVRPAVPALPSTVLREPVAACINERRFDGPALQELMKALGDKRSVAKKPKCALALPHITLLARDGSAATLVFCGGADTAYLEGDEDVALVVANATALVKWMREHGLLPT